MGYKATAWAWEQPARGNAKLVLLALADSANNETGVCWPGLKHVSGMVGLTPSAVSKHIAALEADGLLRREERFRADGSRTSNLVVLALPESAGGLDERQGDPDQRQGGLNQSENQSEKEKKNKKILASQEEPIGFSEWLGQHVAICERHGITRSVPRAGTSARSDLARTFAALVGEGYELEDFRLASEGVLASEFMRTGGHTAPENVLRKTKLVKWIDEGRRVQSAGPGKYDELED